jgi:hypothetical protein
MFLKGAKNGRFGQSDPCISVCRLRSTEACPRMCKLLRVSLLASPESRDLAVEGLVQGLHITLVPVRRLVSGMAGDR